MSQEIADIVQEIAAVLSRKRGYYVPEGQDNLSNALGVEEQGISPWNYQVARIGEKIRRLAGLRGAIDSGRDARDQVRETLKDIAGHAIIGIAVLDRETQNEFSFNQLAHPAPGCTVQDCCCSPGLRP